jgi:hypothetical protein
MSARVSGSVRRRTSRMVCRARSGLAVAAAVEPVASHLPGGGGDRVGAGQGGKGGLASAKRPGCDQPVQHLRGADGADAGDFQQPRRDRGDEYGELGLELVGLGRRGLDALGGGPQRPHGGLVPPATWPAGPAGRRNSRPAWRCCGRPGSARSSSGAPTISAPGLADGGHPGAGGAASGGQQHPQGLPLTPTPRRGQAVLAKRLAGGPDRVQRVALGAAAAGWPLGPTDLQHPLAATAQERGQSGAVAARCFHRPATTARNLTVSEVEQLLVAGRVSGARGLGQHATQAGDGCGGQGACGGCRRRRAPSTCSASMAMRWSSCCGGGRGRCRPGRMNRAAKL